MINESGYNIFLIFVAETSWYKGVPNQSCNEVCNAVGKMCDESKLFIDTKEKLLEICNNLGLNPKDAMYGNWDIRPMFYFPNGNCYGFGRTDLRDKQKCTNKNPSTNAIRICPCHGF